MSIESIPIIGIALAAVGATVLAFGNQLQDDGIGASVDETGADAGLGVKTIRRLLTNRVWLVGTALIGVAMLIQLLSLTVAQLIVVQPVGVLALVVAALITAKRSHVRPTKQKMMAIALCVGGVGIFVTVAAIVAKQHAIDESQLISILLVLAAVLVVILGSYFLFRRRGLHPLFFVIAGGVLSGFVVTLGKTVILRVQTALTERFTIDPTNVLTALCVVAILVAGGLSIYFVQTAHATNRSEVVVAGLTVIDPFVAVVLGITILGEASGAPLWSVAAFVIAGAISVYGVFALSNAKT